MTHYWPTFRSNRLEADPSGVSSVYPMKYLLSGFQSVLVGPCPNEPVIDLRAILIRGLTKLSTAIKIASCMHFWIVLTAFSTIFLFLSSINFSYEPILTCTGFTINTSFLLFKKTIGLRLRSLFLYYVCVGFATNDQILQNRLQLIRLLFLLVLPMRVGISFCANKKIEVENVNQQLF